MSKESSLPPEIITDILSALPGKSLLRFKCVSNSWLSLISSPEFAKLQVTLRKTAKPGILVNYLSRKRNLVSSFMSLRLSVTHGVVGGEDLTVMKVTKYDIPIDIHFHVGLDKLFLVGSCNGLISVGSVFPFCRHFAVFNPTTREVRVIPGFDSTDFHEAKFYGFGYDSHVDDYKLLRGKTFLNFDAVKIEIFNLKANSWRTVKDVFCSHHFLKGKGIFLNGILHWLTSDTDIDRNEYKYVIPRFDLVNERFLDSMVLPSQIDSARLTGEVKNGI